MSPIKRLNDTEYFQMEPDEIKKLQMIVVELDKDIDKNSKEIEKGKQVHNHCYRIVSKEVENQGRGLIENNTLTNMIAKALDTAVAEIKEMKEENRKFYRNALIMIAMALFTQLALGFFGIGG